MEDFVPETQTQNPRRPPPTWLRILAYTALLVASYNLTIMTIDRINASMPCRERTTKAPSILRQPNLYPGLDRIERNESSPGWPLTSFAYPRSVNAVRMADPNRSSKDSTSVDIRPGVSDGCSKLASRSVLTDETPIDNNDLRVSHK